MAEREEDFIVQVNCSECGWFSSEEVSEEVCPECEGELISETSHEGVTCDKCKDVLDMWEDIYRYDSEELSEYYKEGILCVKCGSDELECMN